MEKIEHNGELIILRYRPEEGLSASIEMLETAKAMFECHGKPMPQFTLLPVGVTVEKATEDLASWAAQRGMGIRCSKKGGKFLYEVGSSRGLVASSNSLLGALELAQENLEQS
jgi:hypothetical protein